MTVYRQRQNLVAITLVMAGLFCSTPVLAQSKKAPAAAPQETVTPVEVKPAPYDDDLSRLSEILGALQYIESLCKSTTPNDWRADMSKLIATEAGNEPKRQEKMTASYNRGYRSFAATYTTCTSNAKNAEKTYRNEDATLAQEIASRFGN